MAVRHHVLAAIAVLAMSPGAARAQAGSDATTRANQLAYDYAMKCFVANGIALGDWRDAGNTAQATAQEAKARQSFDTAVKLGRVLGYSGSRIDQDFGLAQIRELPKLMKDGAYFRQTVADCKQLGLM